MVVDRTHWLLGIAALASAGVAEAAPTAVAAAEALYREGRALLAEQKYDLACAKLAKSQELDPAVGTLGLLALCNESRGRTATAWQQYVDVAAQAKSAGQEERASAAAERAQDLESKLSRLRVVVQQPSDGQTVTLNGELLKRAAWDSFVPVDPGAISVRSLAPGKEPWQDTMSLPSAGGRVSITVPPLAKRKGDGAVLQPRESPATPAPTRPPAARDTGGGSPWLAWTSLGLGATGLIVGGVFALDARKKRDDSDPFCNAQDICTQDGVDLRDDALTSARISTVAVGIGVVGLAVGTVLLLTQDSSPQARRAARVSSSRRGVAWRF